MLVKIKWSCGIGVSKLSRIEFLLIGLLILFCNWDFGIIYDFVWKGEGGGYVLFEFKIFKNKRYVGIFLNFLI